MFLLVVYLLSSAPWIGIPVLSYFAGVFSSAVSDEICSVSSDYLHHGNIYGDGKRTSDGALKFRCVCDYCGETFYVIKTDEQLNQAYDKYVTEDLPTPVKTIDSEGGLIWKPTVYDMRTRLVDDYDAMYTDPSTLLGITALNHFISIGDSPDYAIPVVGDNAREFSFDFSVSDSDYNGYPYHNSLCFIAPVAGSYRLLDGPMYYVTLSFFGSYGGDLRDIPYSSTDIGSFSVGDVLRCPCERLFSYADHTLSVTGTFYLPSFAIEPSIPLDTGVGGSFGPDTRPGSVSGDFGYVGEEGEVSKVGDTYFFDESTTTYHNPVTGDTSNVTEWSYDYSDRSYNVVTDSGNTITITYGDENVTITETTTNESGDVITNTYNYYYLVEGSSNPDTPTGSPGSGSSSPSGGEDESLWSKLGQLIGGGLKGIFELLSVIGGIVFDGLMSLFKMILENLKDVVNAFLAIFDQIPQLFTGFLAFLAAVFPFLPSEIIMLLTFGILAVVAIGIIKALRR